MMKLEIALEMMDALNRDDHMSISNIDGYAEEIAQALYEALIKPLENTAFNSEYKQSIVCPSCPNCGKWLNLTLEVAD